MAKMRVHELAKALNKSSREILDTLRQQGIEIQSHMSTVTEEQADRVKSLFNRSSDKIKSMKSAPEAAKPEKASVPSRKDAKPERPDVRKPSRERTAERGAVTKDGFRNHGREGDRRVSPQGSKEERRSDRREDSRTRREGRPAGVREEGRSRRDGQQESGQAGRESRRPANREGRQPAGAEGRREGRDGGRDNRQRPLREGNRERRPGTRRDAGGRDAGGRDTGGRERRADMNRDGNRERRHPGSGEGRPQGGRDSGRERDNRRPGSRDGNRDNRGRGGFGRNTGNERDNRGSRDNRPARDGGRRASFGPDASIPVKESRGTNAKRHELNREHNRDNDRRSNEDGRQGKGNRRKDNRRNEPANGTAARKQRPVKKAQAPAPPKKETPKEEVIRNITLPNPVSLKELADACKVAPSVIIKKLFLAGQMVTINTEFSFDDAAELALEYNCIAEEEIQVDIIEELLKEEDEDESVMEKRPPVVCVMGHVDHGKTSLLDKIRSTNVTAGEAGGITQHIGAYVVTINDEKITFLDTPGHEAFTSMRLRGAQATDIAVLVVAADDGVMPQTIEAINHAKAAEVEVIVAVNKIDKEGANIDRVKQEMTEYGLIAEDWGGDTVFVPVSAKTGEGIDELLEMITLTAEVMELKANPNRKARGLVIEAKLDKGRGPVATILIQKGTLNIGDSISVGHVYGHVRAMIDDKGNRVKTAGPSVPVEILGLNDVPFSGEVMMAADNEKEARTTAEAFIAYGREKMLEDTRSKLSLDDLFDQIQAGNIKELNLVVKADVQGSVEAVRQSLVKLSNEEVKIQVIHGGVGAINESDVTLASASNAIIIGFNVRPDAMAKAAVEREKVDMRLYRVIYTAIEDIEAAMKGMLDPVYAEKVIGHVEVRQTYKASGVGTIAGSYVVDGMVTRDSQARIVRDGIVIYEGNLASLKRFKDDVKEVRAGFECGIVFEKYNDIKEGDQIECFIMEEVPR